MKQIWETLRAFAETTLPPDVVMALECAEDETGDELLAQYGAHLRRCAAEKIPVLPGEDREIRLQRGNRRTLLLMPASLTPAVGTRQEAAALLERETKARRWSFAGVGFGETSVLAAQNACLALGVPADHMTCGRMLQKAQRRLFAEKRVLRISVVDGGGNFCAVCVHPWALRRASAELLDEFV